VVKDKFEAESASRDVGRCDIVVVRGNGRGSGVVLQYWRIIEQVRWLICDIETRGLDRKIGEYHMSIGLIYDYAELAP
jgi:hypothetical protein